jgi:hypothetical protein
MFVGAGLDPTTVPKGMNPVRVNVVIAPLTISPVTLNSGLIPPRTYGRSTGILPVTLNLSVFANDFTSAVKVLCVPAIVDRFQSIQKDWRPQEGMRRGAPFAPTTARQHQIDFLPGRRRHRRLRRLAKGRNGAWAATSVMAVKVALIGFSALKSLAMCFPKDANWNVMPMAAPSGLLGICVNARMNKTGDFCRSAPAMVRFPPPQRR